MSPTHSRLLQKQQSKNLRRTILYLLLTLILLFFLFFLGLPLLIKLAVLVGNFKNASIINEAEDILPPAPPSIFASFTATNSANIVLRGLAENGSSIEVFLNGLPEKKVVAETNGEFVLRNLQLHEGRNEIYAVASDIAGNPSQKSNLLEITFDQTPPSLNLTQSQSGQIFYYPQKTANISGETDGTLLMINDHTVSLDAQGAFNYPYSLQEGENIIRIVVQDEATNQTEQELILFLK
jgi:hypothetical protein